MTDDDDLDRRLDDAFNARSASISATPPDIEDLIHWRHQRTRRSLAAATLAVVAVGVVGVVALAGPGGSTPQDAASDTLPSADLLPSTTTTAIATTTSLVPTTSTAASWQCIGPLGTSGDGAIAYFESCSPSGAFVPQPDTTIQEFPTTTSIADGGIVPVCTIPGCLADYTVRAGDYPLKVAEMFCTSVDELISANDWADAGQFPFPGVVIRLPNTAYYCASPNPTTSILVPTTTAPVTVPTMTVPTTTVPG